MPTMYNFTDQHKAQGNSGKLTASLAMLVMVTFLCQLILPTVAYLKSNSRPNLWNEICSVDGNRNTAENKGAARPDSTPTRHTDCPLCWHLTAATILDTPTATHTVHFLFLNVIQFILITAPAYNRQLLIQESRGPPAFN